MSVLREAAGNGLTDDSMSLTAPPHLRDCVVLLVDDVEFNLIFLKEVFRKAGFSNIHYAGDGMQALDITRTIAPDIVILDLLMPVMDGYAYIAEIRKDPAYANLPVLVQTASDTAREKRRVFRAGASDFATKPIEPFELLSRVFVHLQQRYMLAEIKEKNRRIHDEVEQARRMQFDLLPTDTDLHTLEKQHPVRVVSLFRFSSELGGDMWNATSLDTARFNITSVDFSGHGIAAALNTFRLDTVAQECKLHRGNPSRYVNALNSRLYRLLPPEQFATLFYAVVDDNAQTLSYACAAPPMPFIIRADGTQEFLDNKGFPLGILSDATYDTHTVSFRPGDALFIYSDALIETPLCASPDASCLSEQDVAAAIGELRIEHEDDGAYADAVNMYCSEQYEHMKTRLDDDLTVLCFIYRRDG